LTVQRVYYTRHTNATFKILAPNKYKLCRIARNFTALRQLSQESKKINFLLLLYIIIIINIVIIIIVN